jgi:ABC-type dipeptide/oligopeptide/nickel transport system permease subunit
MNKVKPFTSTGVLIIILGVTSGLLSGYFGRLQGRDTLMYAFTSGLLWFISVLIYLRVERSRTKN